jgi:endo-1,4-beta-xylanase
MIKKHKRRYKKPLIISSLAALIIVLLASGVYLYPRYLAAPPKLPNPPLKDLAAARHVELGSLVKLGLLEHSRPFQGIINSQVAMINSDRELHWIRLRPSATTYNFGPMDKIVAYAQAHHLAVQGHHLLWNEDDSLPKWLKKGAQDGQYNQQQLLELVHQHIKTVVGRYKGKVAEWTVVNEPFTRAVHTYGLDDWWGDHLGGGTSYIDKAFVWAHEADPHAKLILNDFNNEVAGPIANAQYTYMKSARARGIPIDGIGMQMHLDASRPPSQAAMVANMKRFGGIGYQVYITEFDINSTTVKGSAAYKQQLEAQLTATVVRACLQAQNCVSLNLFGLADRTNLVSVTASRQRSNLFTQKYQPKPAFYAFRQAWLDP